MTDILMPALSPTMEEGTLTKWHIKAGDTVSAGQVIAEIETDKATMEFEAVDEGTLGKILIAEDLHSGERKLCTRGHFVMVALDADGRPTSVPPLPPQA